MEEAIKEFYMTKACGCELEIEKREITIFACDEHKNDWSYDLI